ncbi:MAG: sugar phosphate isomerase/epimerase family protein [Chloroflexota bacterium]
MFTKNKIGVATWIFGKRPLTEIAQRAADLNFAGVALFADLASYSAAEAKQILGEHGLEIFALTPPEVDLAHPDAQVRQAAIDAYLALFDFAAAVDCPLVLCQGLVGRTRPFSTRDEEIGLFRTAVSRLAQRAQAQNIRFALNVLNRYETHLFNTCSDALALIDDIGADNLGVSLGAFHMNMEEQDAMAAINKANGRFALYHVSDSNRQAIGRGHLKLGLQLWALENIGYDGPIIVECLPPKSSPATLAHDDAQLETHLRESRSWF